MYILEVKNGCQPDCRWIKILGHNVASWAKYAVNFQLKLRNQTKKKLNPKTEQKGVREKIKTIHNFGSIGEQIESRYEALW